MLARQTGLSLRDRDLHEVGEALVRRLRAVRLSHEDYLLLQSDTARARAEWSQLMPLVTNSETYFLRDQGQHDLLRQRLLPGIIERRRAENHRAEERRVGRSVRKAAGRTLRVWSAGCSNGEEAYSLAILLDELLPAATREREGWEVSIWGTDINESALETARRGIYGEWSLRVMAEVPHPILIISSSIPGEAGAILPVLLAGAVDVIAKPPGAAASNPDVAAQATRELVAKIKLVAGVVVFTHRRNDLAAPLTIAATVVAPEKIAVPATSGAPEKAAVPGAAILALDAQLKSAERRRLPRLAPGSAPRLVAIGASTGGPQTLAKILSRLPADYALPIVCVQHISEGFVSGLVEWLDGCCALRVQLARAGAAPVAGTVWLAPDDVHLCVNAAGRFSVSSAPPLDSHRPSVTTLFESVAASYGAGAVGVLLTGMGSDGAQGLSAISLAGGFTIAQDEASCVVFGMPARAIELGAAQHILPPDAIADLLGRLGERTGGEK